MEKVDNKNDLKTVREITIDGNKNINKNEIFYGISLKVGDEFSKDKAQKDMKTIFNMGLFKDVKIKLEKINNGYRVIFNVLENEIVKKIKIEGNRYLSYEDIKKVFQLKEGKIFSHKLLKDDLERISVLYKEKGSILSDIEINFDDQGILIKLIEGKIETINVMGNKKVNGWDIKKEIEIKPGDIFEFEKVKNSLQKIYNLGYFDNVTMRLEPGSKKGLIKLIIKVVETNKLRNKISAFINYFVALIFFITVYLHFLFPTLFYEITEYLPFKIDINSSFYLHELLGLLIIAILSYYLFEKRFDKKSFFSYLFSYFINILIFPIKIINNCITYLFFCIIQIITLIMKTSKIAQKYSIQIFLFIVDLLALFLIIFSNNNTIIKVSMAILFITLIYHLSWLSDQIINPNLIYFELFKYIEKRWASWKEKELKIDHINNTRIDMKGLNLFIKMSEKLFKGLENIVNFLYGKKGVLFSFIIFFISSILITIFVFSFEYYGLTKIDNNSFVNLSEDQYFDHLFYSTTIYSTVNPGNIIPSTLFSKFFVMLQILVSIVIFYVFIISFQFLAFDLTSLDKPKLLTRTKEILEYLEDLKRINK